MKDISPSTRIYIGLILVLAVLAAANVFLPQGDFSPTLPEQQLPAPKPVVAAASAGLVLVVYGGLGYAGLRLSRKLGFPDLWDAAVSNRQRLWVPALVGVGTGIFFVLIDAGLSPLHALGPLPHPPFPTSLVASVTAAIGEEVMFRLFFISFWVWLISQVILRGRWQRPIFWVMAVLSALAFALGHFPGLMLVLGLEEVSQIPAVLVGEIILLNGTLSLLAAHYFRKSGFMAAVGIHFWADIVWHVIWGLI